MPSSIFKLSSFLVASMAIIFLFPSLHSFPPAEAIRSSSLLLITHNSIHQFSYKKSTRAFKNNAMQCESHQTSSTHIAMTLDVAYLRGTIAAVHSILHHSLCPKNIFFHFIVDSDSDTGTDLYQSLLKSIFPSLTFKIYIFDPKIMRHRISSSVRQPLEQPLNYARNYLAHLLEPSVQKVIYLDSDLVVVDDISKLWMTNLDTRAIGAPEYCHTNFTKYFTTNFWSENRFSKTFNGRKPCYFNTGVMIIDLVKWRQNGYTKKIERWMEIQRDHRIYELGSLPPFLLVFAGHVAPVEHRWNQHGLGGDNANGSCRDMHPGPTSLLHWSGGGKPWLRLDSNLPCPLDWVWAQYDLYKHSL
ncbi:unnamed protein product [Camellia sinensis]